MRDLQNGPDRLIDWLQSDGLGFRETTPFVEAFAVQLMQAGIDVCRFTTGVPVLHPQVDSLSSLWELGKPATERRFRQVGDLVQQFVNSPMAVVYAGGEVRCSLEAPPQPGEYPILADLRADGDHRLPRAADPVFRRLVEGGDAGDAAAGRLSGGTDRKIPQPRADAGDGPGDPDAAADDADLARHLCRPDRRPARSRRGDQARHVRADRGNHLVLRPPRLHRADGTAAGRRDA